MVEGGAGGLLDRLPDFESGVLRSEGKPSGVRCGLRLDRGRQEILVQPEPGVSVRPGPASLLCHGYDQKMWDPRSFLVYGTLYRERGGWMFTPKRVMPGAGVGGVKGILKFIFGSR